MNVMPLFFKKDQKTNQQYGRWFWAVALALFLGLGSAAYALNNGLRFTTVKSGQWVRWIDAGRPAADPYTKAYTAKTGQLFLTPSHGQTFLTYEDDRGQRLHSSCTYQIKGDMALAKWWEVSAYELNGNNIIISDGQKSFSSATAMVQANNQFIVTLSPVPQAGNWLKLDAYGRFTVRLHLYRPQRDEQTLGTIKSQFSLPILRRVSC